MKKLIAVVAILFASIITLQAQVTKVALSLDSTTNTGKCPRTLRFKLLITCSNSSAVNIIWRKSDNTTQVQNSNSVKAGVNTFFYDWKIASDFAGNISVLVNSSDHKESNAVSFKVTCK